MKKGILYTVGSVIILILCFIAFILPSSLGRGSQSTIPVFGSYNKKQIRYDNKVFQNAVQYYGQMYQYYGMEITPEIHYDIYKEAFKQAALATAYQESAEKTGLQIPDSAINRQLRTYFQDENGKYSEKLYRQADPTTVKNQRMDIEESIVRATFYEDNFGSKDASFGKDAFYGAKISDAEIAFLQNYGTDFRAFSLASFDKANYPEEEKAKYAAANKAKFAKYDMSVITVEDEVSANKVLARLNNNELSFLDAVTEYSIKNYSNTEGKVNSNYQYQIENMLDNKEDLAKLTDLEIGKISPVIKTRAGYSIFQADGEITEADLESDTVKRTVSSYITAYESTMIEDYFTAKAKEFVELAKNGDFEKACTETGATFVEIPAFPMNYGSVNVTESVDTSLDGLSNADKNENFLKTAFALKENELSEPLVLNNTIAVLKLTSVEKREVNTEDTSSLTTNVNDYDSSSAESVILSNPNFKDNFSSVYFSQIASN
ncbi:MAG: SurA N-terminal domain-containing protein [Treponema sp.]|nr:SurA N-terminal domain-containing protein [Treponema sp.]